MTTSNRPDGEVFASGASEGEVLEFPAVPRGWGVTIDGKDESGEKVTDPTNGIPPMEWMNALLQRIDSNILWLLQNAWPDWAAGTWPAGSVVVSDDMVYRAQKETAVKPTSSVGDWLPLFPMVDLDKRYLRSDGDSNYLHVDKNLSDLDDTAEAKKNLGLDKVGNYKAVQAMGGRNDDGKSHDINIDWGPDNKLHATVDDADKGAFYTTENPPTTLYISPVNLIHTDLATGFVVQSGHFPMPYQEASATISFPVAYSEVPFVFCYFREGYAFTSSNTASALTVALDDLSHSGASTACYWLAFGK